MKAIVLAFEDVDAGATANEITLLAKVAFVGVDVPNGPRIDHGPLENGIPILINITQLAQYPDRVEDALIARAAALGLPTLLRTDCLFPSYTRGA